MLHLEIIMEVAMERNKKKWIIGIIIILILGFFADKSDNSINVRQKYVLMCQDAIKKRLQHPSTYKKEFATDKIEKYHNQTGVIIYFSAKNSYNLALKFQGTCLFNDNFQINSVVIKEVN